MKIEIEIISKELIKPSSSTPQHLTHLHYSFIDQTQPHLSLSFTHFYSHHPQSTNLQKRDVLKTSLSEVLTIFYPVAGRVRNDQSYIECNDEGVLFVEAKASCTLSEVLRDRNPSNNNYFTPCEPYEAGSLGGFSQITWLSCGGCAISFGMSHKLGDASSMFTFLNTWASIARCNGNNKSTVTSPSCFGYASLFPPAKMEPMLDYDSMVAKENVVTKLFTFDGSNITAIKDKYSSASHEPGRRRVSRVEALTGFILGRFMATTQTVKGNDNTKSCVVIQAVNLRPRMDPPLSELCFGNFSTGATTEAAIEIAKDEYCIGVVQRMRDSATNISDNFNKIKDNKEQVLNFFKGIMEKFRKQEEVVSFMFSFLHTFSMYESDFGWGKPLWVGLTPILFKNQVMLLGSRDGEAIEAQVCLKEEDMAKFEIDHQLLAHVSSPSNG